MISTFLLWVLAIALLVGGGIWLALLAVGWPKARIDSDQSYCWQGERRRAAADVTWRAVEPRQIEDKASPP